MDFVGWFFRGGGCRYFIFFSCGLEWNGSLWCLVLGLGWSYCLAMLSLKLMVFCV